MAEKTTKQLLEEQATAIQALTELVANLAQRQDNLFEEVQNLKTAAETEREAIDDAADAMLVKQSPIVEVFYDEDEPRIIGFNNQPKIVLQRGINRIPKVYADRYLYYQQDAAFAEWNAKRLAIPDNAPQGYRVEQLEQMLLEGRKANAPKEKNKPK